MRIYLCCGRKPQLLYCLTHHQGSKLLSLLQGLNFRDRLFLIIGFAGGPSLALLKPATFTVPVPFPDNSKSAVGAFVISLSVIVMPSITACVFAIAVVNVTAAGVVAPITVLSIAPPSMSAFAISMLPVPGR